MKAHSDRARDALSSVSGRDALRDKLLKLDSARRRG